jgi:hypothetical protein
MHNLKVLLTAEAPAAALPADLSGLEGVIHSLLSSALEKIVDRMYRTSLQKRRSIGTTARDSRNGFEHRVAGRAA